MGSFPLIGGNFEKKSIVSIDQFDKASFLKIFREVPQMRVLCQKELISTLLKGKIISLLFFEPSSRTFSSFAAAIKRLGGQTLEFQNLENASSVKKGETFTDSIRTFGAYSDGIIMRHKEPMSAYRASLVSDVPIINAGDGSNEHPTQALLDLYTIFEKFKTLDNLTGVFAGDLLNGRTVHSLLKGLSKFRGNTIYLLSPKKLRMPASFLDKITTKDLKIHEIYKDTDIPKEANFWYWTRVQKERFSNLKEYERLKNYFVLSKKLLREKGDKNLILMHPLPRVGEIEEDVDSDPRALYFRNQIKNGLYVRMALLSLIFK